MTQKIVPLVIPPGIKRDGTEFSSQNWIDGQWVRFQKGHPRKMGGYSLIISQSPSVIPLLPEKPTGIYVIPDSTKTNQFKVFVGTANGVYSLHITTTPDYKAVAIDAFFKIPIRDPFKNDLDNLWTFDVIFNNKDPFNGYVLLAHAAPNLKDIDQTEKGVIFYKKALDDSPFLPVTVDNLLSISQPPGTIQLPPNITSNLATASGFVILYPYIFIYDDQGQITILDPTDWEKILEQVHVTDKKIVYGHVTRGGQNSPAGLFWSLDTLIRATFVGPKPEDFRFDVISDQISILSSRSVVEYDGIFFWAATNRFLTYTGIVQEIPNTMSINFFFEHLNFNQKQKVWATKIPHYGEIWWFFPKGDSKECNHALIYNVREHIWYDTPLPHGRGAGYYDQNFVSPLWTDNMPDAVPPSPSYGIWQHEYGFDELRGGQTRPIHAFIESADISLMVSNNQPGIDRWMEIERFEPDLNQEGPMTLTIKKRRFARSTPEESQFLFDKTTEKIDMREHGRIISLKFESNEVEGFFELGQNLVTLKTGDGRA